MEKFLFEKYLSSWTRDTSFLSVGQFDNENFKSIVRMGEDAVPFIAETISREPSQIVYALAAIYGEKVRYRPFMSLKRLCRLWLKILRKEGKI